MSSQADGAPIAPAALQRAAEWMARLWAEDASVADADACAAWRAAHPEHERAWARLQRFARQFDALPREVARGALAPVQRRATGRRRALQLLGLIAAGGGTALLAHESGLWQRTGMGSDYRTAVGETRAIVLADGTQVVLDTASAIDVRYNAGERRIVLRAGAILVTSAHENAAVYRPLLVATPQGTATALGTRFSVRLDDGVSQVAVFQGAVALQPARAGAESLHLQAGQRAGYTRQDVQDVASVEDSAAAWAQGSLVAERMRLDDLLAELGRYRHGVLRCDESIAALRVTGVYTLRDTDRSLANLALSLPVQLRYRTRYWVSVGPRQAS
ncbi:fec operon regulator FecR [Janthinobacterium sp. HH103]|uniref:FecR domain-containing protein n=1 Tax=unclassified Janthinobacterium TaxID=2610881 RepID=UPI000873C2E9|nr:MULTISPECIES: FecR domain-containing protein [unclassified Janthinobacterium]OEZ72688.1 fec operon regulator FecR [Janthinobacterium sp. HH100]OEZ86812.1 fec operon regulator FecR [Janthinobacterium sp. HH103]QOU73918.1 Protein FecR [Janthinobacterium sp. HH102]